MKKLDQMIDKFGIIPVSFKYGNKTNQRSIDRRSKAFTAITGKGQGAKGIRDDRAVNSGRSRAKESQVGQSNLIGEKGDTVNIAQLIAQRT